MSTKEKIDLVYTNIQHLQMQLTAHNVKIMAEVMETLEELYAQAQEAEQEEKTEPEQEAEV